MNRFYVSDLDGTLLRDDATLSDFSRETLASLIADGLVFTIATARSVVSARAMLDGLPLSLPIVEFNGAFISDLATGRHEIVQAIDPGICGAIYERIHAFGHVPFVSTYDGEADRLYYCELRNEGMRWYEQDRIARRDSRLRHTDDLRDALREQVICLTVIGEEAPLRDLRLAVHEEHGASVVTLCYENRYSPGWWWLTFHDHRATKDRGLRTLRETYGLQDRHLTVFGDHDNDIPMFQLADHAVAVANATDALKAHAHEVIGTNEEDSVARYLMRG